MCIRDRLFIVPFSWSSYDYFAMILLSRFPYVFIYTWCLRQLVSLFLSYPDCVFSFSATDRVSSSHSSDVFPLAESVNNNREIVITVLTMSVTSPQLLWRGTTEHYGNICVKGIIYCFSLKTSVICINSLTTNVFFHHAVIN